MRKRHPSIPNNENFCGYGTGLQCVPFVWRYGVMTQLATAGRHQRGFRHDTNNHGQVADMQRLLPATRIAGPVCK